MKRLCCDRDKEVSSFGAFSLFEALLAGDYSLCSYTSTYDRGIAVYLNAMWYESHLVDCSSLMSLTYCGLATNIISRL